MGRIETLRFFGSGENEPDPTDRRGAPRHDLERAVKVFQPRTGRYLAGRTINASDTGFLLELAAPDPEADAPFIEDEGLRVLVSWDNNVLLHAADSTEARVVRIDGPGRVAVTQVDAAGALAAA
ncbi:MAG: hypothetical protein AAGB51_05315 [Planctomycetota bacterium]